MNFGWNEFLSLDFRWNLQNFSDEIQRIFSLLFVTLLIYIVISFLLYYILFHQNQRNSYIKSSKLPKINSTKRVLLVIAHPDDECMFFGPTLATLAQNQEYRIFVLCLSKGDYELKGNTRKQELWESCKVLGIKADDITLISSPFMQDGPSQEWKVEIISSHIIHQVESLDIDLIITFDKNGISHHPNHCAIYHATAALCLHQILPNRCKILTLETVNVVRKYVSILDVAVSLLLSLNNCWAIISWSQRELVQMAMQQHKSQMVWFRKLYIIFSRYMLINTLQELTVENIELDILET